MEEEEVLLVDKELNWTSFDVVKKLRSSLGIKKIGHAGTLDPLATGLLILCTGKKTKSISSFQELPKTYQGKIYLGGETPSYDAETLPKKLVAVDHLKKEDIENVFHQFIGNSYQTPPTYSAIKIGGKRAYQYARENKKIMLKPRPITIYNLKIKAFELPEVVFEMQCSKGTYVRSFAYDVGKKLEVGAYLSSLRRTKIGKFDVAAAFKVNQIIENKKQKS